IYIVERLLITSLLFLGVTLKRHLIDFILIFIEIFIVIIYLSDKKIKTYVIFNLFTFYTGIYLCNVF
ncbi:hypothetical protein, partial [Proteus mirabilis]|uniref:hypothetical protein n=1 Tax=Proteus mirabilis TaxID=584 RepID=UPI0019536501